MQRREWYKNYHNSIFQFSFFYFKELVSNSDDEIFADLNHGPFNNATNTFLGYFINVGSTITTAVEKLAAHVKENAAKIGRSINKSGSAFTTGIQNLTASITENGKKMEKDMNEIAEKLGESIKTSVNKVGNVVQSSMREIEVDFKTRVDETMQLFRTVLRSIY